MARVTVYIPAYNHEPFVGAAVQSVLDQSFTDFELIVADDASTDGTLEVIQRFNDPRMTVVPFPTNRGADAVANHCIRSARGDYISPLSSDDVFHPHKLQRQVEYLDAHPEVLAVVAAPDCLDESGAPMQEPHAYSKVFTSNNRPREESLRQFFFNGCDFAHTSLMVRRSAFERFGLYHDLLRQSPDLDFFVRLLLNGEVHVISGPLSSFRVRSGMQNISAPTPKVIGTMQLELSWVLRRFLHPFVLDNLPGIFGERWGTPRHEAEARLILAEIAWSVMNPAHRTFAAHTLWDTRLDGLDPAFIEEFRERGRKMLSDQDVYRMIEASVWEEKKQRLQRQKNELRAKRDEALNKAQRASDELKRCRRSLSWRLTNPLRALQRLLGGSAD